MGVRERELSDSFLVAQENGGKPRLYHSEYALPLLPTRLDELFTPKTPPSVCCSDRIVVSSSSVCQPSVPEISSGTREIYPAVFRSWSDLGAFCLSSVY